MLNVPVSVCQLRFNHICLPYISFFFLLKLINFIFNFQHFFEFVMFFFLSQEFIICFVVSILSLQCSLCIYLYICTCFHSRFVISIVHYHFICRPLFSLMKNKLSKLLRFLIFNGNSLLSFIFCNFFSSPCQRLSLQFNFLFHICVLVETFQYFVKKDCLLK